MTKRTSEKELPPTLRKATPLQGVRGKRRAKIQSKDKILSPSLVNSDKR